MLDDDIDAIDYRDIRSENSNDITDILRGLLARAEAGEVIQFFAAVETTKGMEPFWSGSVDVFSIAGFAIYAAFMRMAANQG